MEPGYQITLPDIGLVIEKLMGGGYVSQYSKREFRLDKKVKFNLFSSILN